MKSSRVRLAFIALAAAALEACIVVSAPPTQSVAYSAASSPMEREDHRCGPDFGGAACGNNRCCSQFAWCGGLDEDHCNSAHGYGGQYDGPRVSDGERADHRCGPNFEGARCGGDRCCSGFDWCGGPTEDHCNSARGYDGQFDGPAAPPAPSRYGSGAGF